MGYAVLNPSDEGDAPHERPSRRHRRRWPWFVAAVVAVALALVLAYVLFWNRSPSRPVSIDEARERADTDGYGDDGLEAASLRPAAGVYVYIGDGTESLDKPPTQQAQGPEMPGTVTHLDGGCWRFRIDYSTNHWQTWDYCASGGTLIELGGSSFQRLDLGFMAVDTTSTFTCDPPADTIRATQQPGDEWLQECRGTSSSTGGEVVSAGPYVYLGEDDLDIGGTSVRAHHYRRSRTLTGAQTGTEVGDVWFDAATGLPLQNRRDIQVFSDSLIGQVTFEETGSFSLTSMTTRR